MVLFNLLFRSRLCPLVDALVCCLVHCTIPLIHGFVFLDSCLVCSRRTAVQAGHARLPCLFPGAFTSSLLSPLVAAACALLV